MRRDLPSGTVTFLFTDVEGSTRLLHELGAEAYAEALAEHRRVIREACALQGGVEVDTQGDAFFFAFPTAPGALAAAAAFTRELRSGLISVRVGLHTGSPLLAEEGYVGDDVHFAARVAATSHGGQVVCSAATAELIDAPLTHLGSHRLKDVSEPVSIYQLGEDSFPPLKTIANSNLPTPASSFLGREDELYAADELLQQTRLLTIAGPGGQGKTRFALELARRAREERFSDYPDGVFACFLASLRDPSLVLPTTCQTLNVREQPAQSALEALSSHLQGKRMLLLVDNAEHLLEAASDLSQLLQQAEGLTLLVTSRELIRIQGETTYSLPPLPENEGIALFCERARLEPSPEIAELCTRLEGLPLAIELAAARTAILTPAQLLVRLSQRLDLLKAGRDADPRQQTLRATIEWSYDLLTPEEQQLFARLSVFQGGCTLDAAEEVCDADLDTLQSLVDKSLLRFSDERFWMLETIREFAWERLQESRDALAPQHAQYYARMAAGNADSLMRHAPEAYATLADERGNMRSALEHAVVAADGGIFSDLLYGLWRYWLVIGSGVEAQQWAKAYAYSVRSTATALQRYIADIGASEIFRFTGDADLAVELKLECLGFGRAMPEVVVHGRSVGRWTAALLSDLSSLALEAGRVDEAQMHSDEALALRRQDGNVGGIAHALGAAAMIAYTKRDFARARELTVESLAGWEAVGRQEDAAMAMLVVAECDVLLGNLDDVSAHLRSAIESVRREPDISSAVHLSRIAAMLAAARGHHEWCATLFGFADSREAETGITMFGRSENEVQRRYFEDARRALGELEFSTATARGACANPERSYELAIEYLSID